jgi:uncharacterized protein
MRGLFAREALMDSCPTAFGSEVTPTRLGSFPDKSPWMGCLLLIFTLLIASCNLPQNLSTDSTSTTDALPAPGFRLVTSTTEAPPKASPNPTNTPPPTLTATPDAYTGLSIPDLRARSYGGGELEIVETLAANSLFTRALIRYPSDGLMIYGFMNIPQGDGPFPVVIALHGYIDPSVYLTLDYTTGYADELARNGYLVLHPNLRGYAPSEDGPNLFRIGMAVDVLNLIALVQDQAGKPGPLTPADVENIGLWGHSMGGGISTRVMTISPDVDAVVLYGAMSGDEQKNFERILNVFSDGQRGLEELSASVEVFQRVSPINFLEEIEAAVSIHHGVNDPEVPLDWSLDLCDRLELLGKTVECFLYEGQAHTFTGDGELLFIFRMVDFFDRYLKSDD